jgi:hypothetical protein
MNTIEKALTHALFVHDKEDFEYKGKTVAAIPNRASQADLEAL